MASAALRTDLPLWIEEPASRPDRARIRARIGGLHCLLYTGTIEKALNSQPGVDKVAINLTHEQALVEYDPANARPTTLLGILRDIGYTISDPRKVRPFEEERDLVRESRRFVVAVALSVASIPIIAEPSLGWIGFLPALVCLSLGALLFLVLRKTSLLAAVASTAGLAALALSLLYLNLHGYLATSAPWLVATLAVIPGNGCVEKVREAVIGVPGERQAKPSAWHKRVTVTFEAPRIEPRQIKLALGSAGFETGEIRA